ncbi:MAG: RDD family protein [Acidobacteriia bacterium]|nr:RDD family protein [Terriglobia bacterium]
MILTAWWVWRTAKNFRSQTGPFDNLIIACLALALAILYTVPIKSVQLFAKRIVAFLVDLALLAVFTVGVTHLLFQGDVVEPSAVVSMVIVWIWFLLFVLVDWRIRGTPGQLMLGLRLRTVGQGSSGFTKCLARNLLTFVVPIVLAGRLLIAPFPYPKLGIILRLCAGYAGLSVVPLSIVFTGGQTLPDLLLGMSVLPRRAALNEYASRLNKKRWVFLILASLVTGFILAYSTYLQSELARRPPVPPLSQTSQSDSGASAWLWPRLQAGIYSPDSYVQDVEVFSVSGDLRSDIREALESTPCSGTSKLQGNALLVEAQVWILTPATFKGVLYKNLGDTISAQVPASKRPAFLLFDLTTKQGFGAFTFTTAESSALCISESEGRPVDALVMTGESLRARESVGELSALAVGNLKVYSDLERLPIWSR